MAESQPSDNKALDLLSEKDKLNVFKAGNRKRGRPTKDTPVIIKAAAKALKQAGMTNKEIALQLNLKEAAIQSLLLGSGSVKPEDLEKVKTEFAGQMAGIVMKLLMKADSDEFVERINGAQLITGVAILVDKINLITGKPTQITETKSVVEQAANQLKQLEDLEASLMQSLKLPVTPQVN